MGSQTPPYIPAPVAKQTEIEKWADKLENLINELNLDGLVQSNYLEFFRVSALTEILDNKVFGASVIRINSNVVEQQAS